jgi:hypothetical protein
MGQHRRHLVESRGLVEQAGQGGRVVARRGQQRTRRRGQQQDVRVDLALVVVGQGLDGGPVAGLDGRLQLGEIRDEARHRGEGVGEIGPPLIHEGTGFVQVPRQLGFDLGRHPGVHEREGKAQRKRGQQHARQEDPIGQ